MTWFPCSYLHSEVECTAEREWHIAEGHPDLLPEYRDQIAETLAEPNQVRGSMRLSNARLFSRWYPDVRGGKYVVVVVVRDAVSRIRHWIITAYIARELAQGVVEWQRN